MPVSALNLGRKMSRNGTIAGSEKLPIVIEPPPPPALLPPDEPELRSLVVVSLMQRSSFEGRFGRRCCGGRRGRWRWLLLVCGRSGDRGAGGRVEQVQVGTVGLETYRRADDGFDAGGGA